MTYQPCPTTERHLAGKLLQSTTDRRDGLTPMRRCGLSRWLTADLLPMAERSLGETLAGLSPFRLSGCLE